MYEKPKLTEAQTIPKPEVKETDQSGLILVEMLSIEDDKEVLKFQTQNQEHIAEFGNTIYKSVEEVTANRLERAKQGGRRFWIQKDGANVGWEGFVPIDDGKSAEIGLIVAKSASGHGYGTSAIKALTKHIENDFGSVIGEARSDHAASIAVLEKSGYVKVAENVQKDWAGDLGTTVLRHTK